MTRIAQSLVFWLVVSLLSPGIATSGSLVLVGGGLARDDRETHRQIFKRRIQRRPLCIVAAAHPKPIRALAAKVTDFERHMGAKGPRFVLGLPLTLDSAKATNSAVVNSFARCGGFFFTDGDPSRIRQVLMPKGVPSATLTLLRRAFETGAVVAGTGAGSVAIADLVLTEGDSATALEHGVVGEDGQPGLVLEPGIGLWSGVALEQKALAEGRFGRLLAATRQAPERLGFAIDVGTALIVDDVHGSPQAKVLGKSHVLVVEAGGEGVADRFYVLGSGDGYDIAARRPVVWENQEPGTPPGPVEALANPWQGDAFYRGLLDFAAASDTTWRIGEGAASLKLTKGEGYQVLTRRAGLFAGPIDIR